MPSAPSLKKLGEAPRDSKVADKHIWADYIELLCLVNIDRRVSKSDILDRIWERQDLGELREFDPEDMYPGAAPVPEEYEESPSQLEFYTVNSDRPVAVQDFTVAERSDRNRRQVDQWFEFLRYREQAFGDFYPFELDGQVLYCRDGVDSDQKARLYVFLLLCSCLKYFGRYHHYLTDRFEVVSLIALKSYLPRRGKVIFVSDNPFNQGPYRGTTWHKIITLAKEIGEKPNVHCTESSFEAGSTGDGGLDIAGKVPIGDEEPGYLLLFGQCACGKEWTDKKWESHVARWRHYINFTVPPNNLLFVPHCFRSADGGWYRYLDVTEAILIDRLRLIHLLEDRIQLLQRCVSFEDLVDYVLDYCEPSV